MAQIKKINHKQIHDMQNAEVYILLKRIVQQVCVRPMLIGISGCPHTGKKTLAQNVSKILGHRQTIILDTADYNFSRYYRTPHGLTGANPLGANINQIKNS